ncbi:MAG TPA: hypothetical protein VFE25_00370 [Opitutaceae bacterium]|nr:hypothetical protein [Opitutaceae bacterium]
MKSVPQDIRRFQFRFPRLDMDLQVEVVDEVVTVRASRNAFNAQRKDSFIRELASEGFIPESNLWRSLTGGRGIKWIIDRSWMGFDEMAAAYNRRIGIGTFSGMLLGTALMMALLFGGYLGNFRVLSAPAPAAQHASATSGAASLPSNQG